MLCCNKCFVLAGTVIRLARQLTYPSCVRHTYIYNAYIFLKDKRKIYEFSVSKIVVGYFLKANKKTPIQMALR